MAYLYARAPYTGGHVEHKKSHTSIKHLVIVVSVIFEDVINPVGAKKRMKEMKGKTKVFDNMYKNMYVRSKKA